MLCQSERGRDQRGDEQAVIHFESVTEAEPIEYLISLESARQKTVLADAVLLLVDSGAYEHACPKEFAPWLPLATEDEPHVVGPNGGELKIFGERAVGATTMDDSKGQIHFRFMSVTGPILSVSKLVKMGYEVIFTSSPCILNGRRMLMLCQRKGLYFSPVRVGMPQGSATWTKLERSRVNYLQMGPMLRVAEPKRCTTVELPRRHSEVCDAWL